MSSRSINPHFSTQNEDEPDTWGQDEWHFAPVTQYTSNQSPSPATQRIANQSPTASTQRTFNQSPTASTQRTSNKSPAASTQRTAYHSPTAVVTKHTSDQSSKSTRPPTVTLSKSTKKRK